MTIDYEAANLPPFSVLDEPMLAFSPDDQRKSDIHPLRGLRRFGAYTQSSFKSYTPQLRIATVGPASGRIPIGNLLKALRDRHKPGDRAEYVPEYPGFESLFDVPLVAAPAGTHIKWPDSLSDLGRGETAEARIHSAMTDALDRLSMVRDQFDVVVVHLPDSWASSMRSKTFDAHDALKALGAHHSIPTQVINDRAFAFKYKASIAWRLSIALYVKAGGVPWKLAPLPGVPESTAYIGLAYALRGNPQEAHYVTCCSQVFDVDGGGMQFVAFEARDPVLDLEEARRNPFLSRQDMRAVLARSLQLYQARNGGSLPQRLVLHKTTAFKTDELNGTLDALAGIREIDCVEVGTGTPWRGVWQKKSTTADRRSEPDRFPIPRGTVLQRSGSSAFVWVAGNAPAASTTGDYYQGKKSIPRPLVLTRFAGSGPLELTALEALALTKMDWNNDALYDPVPVTLRYSQRLAKTIANVPTLPGNTYPYRLFM
jgi:hypothetical protein